MKHRLILCLVAAMFGLSLYAIEDYDRRIDDALTLIDQLINNSETRRRQYDERADSLRRRLSTPSATYQERMRLYDEMMATFRRRNVDSTWHYSQLALTLARQHSDSARIKQIHIEQILDMPLLGHVHEAIVRIDSLSRTAMDVETRKLYYRHSRLAFLCISSIYALQPLHNDYFKRYVAMNDSLLALTTTDNPRYKLYEGVHHFGEGRLERANALFEEYLESTPVENEKYGDATTNLALSALTAGAADKWLYYLCLTAIHELECGYVDGEALRHLSANLYEQGQIKRAYRYLIKSQQNINNSGAVVRSLHNAGSVAMMVKAYRELEARNTLVLWFVVGLVLLSLVLLYLMMHIRMRGYKSLSILKTRLAEANKVKEVYIGEFMTLCSSFMSKMEDFNRTVSRKIKAGQIDDLLQMVSSGRYIDGQNKMFYDVFDSAFINIYPDFINEVNALLINDKHFPPLESTALTPELRILAFMRLGIDDSAKLAQFLGLSLSTVYTYRNRLKGRAKNRETFERDIRSICGLD